MCKNVQSAILCGGAFMERNKVVQELHNKRIVVDGKFFILETPALCPNPIPDLQFSSISLQSIPMISPYSFVDIELPASLEPNQTYLIKPSDDSSHWQPQTLQAVGNLIKFQNDSEEFILPTDQSGHLNLLNLPPWRNHWTKTCQTLPQFTTLFSQFLLPKTHWSL